MDLATILRAIELVGEATPAARALYEGFIAITEGGDQTALRLRYAEARVRSDDLHQQVQATIGG